MILAVVCPSLPAVVVVEDIHLMGPAFAEFLQVLQVRNPARPVLIVGTAWPEAHDRGAYAAWRDAALTAGQLVLVDVPDLPATDLREFVYQAAPNSSPADVGRLIGHYPNPLALQLFLGLDSTRRRITRHHGALPIKAGELAGLPREDVRDLYRAMWLELPEPVRRILTLAAGVLPPHADLTWPFLPEIVTDTGITTGDLQAVDAADTVTRNLQAAVTVHHWVVPTEPHGTYRFREAVLDDVAAEGLDPTDRTEITAAAIACLRRWIDIRRAGYWQVDPERADEQTALVGRWLWRLIPTDGTVTEADLAGGYLAARLLGDAHQPAAAHDLMNSRPWRSTYPADHQAPLMIRSFNGTWLGDAGRVDDAITEFGMLLADQHRIHGPDHPNTLTTRNNLAIWLGQAGRLDAAITELQVLLADQHRIHGPDHPHTLTTRNNLASLHGHAGRLDAAITELQVLLADQHRIHGPDHPNTLTTRNNLASLHGHAGRLDAAIAELQVLLAD
jgi:tetratricopeptide (TPR) repeat protein